MTEQFERFLRAGPESFSDGACGREYAGRRILVSGAGGFIGAGLVKALAEQRPGALVLLDAGEHNLFRIERHLRERRSDVSFKAILGGTGDTALMGSVFNDFRPEIVFHAAAYKHVALLERNPFAALQNNAVGTYRLAEASVRFGCEKLVLVSTDKAVQPHSVMGVSKRLAELGALSLGGNAVRLGNVIGSSGSVVPIFLEQIAGGGPVTVTHPEASRYFLTIQETVMALLAAGLADCTGRVLLPALTAPVRIAELAEFLVGVNRNGRGSTIPVVFTGLRAGEKLVEDLVGIGERRVGFVPGPLEVIETRRWEMDEMREAMERIASCVAKRDEALLLEVLTALVPDFRPSEAMLGSGA